MKELELNDDAVIDLGQASVETKGEAIFQSDTGAGRLLNVMGIAND